MIILKATKIQSLTFSLEDTFLEKPQGSLAPSHFRVNKFKKRLQRKYFPVKTATFLRTPIGEHLRTAASMCFPVPY